jgi:DNA-binding transcriptional MerR regulator
VSWQTRAEADLLPIGEVHAITGLSARTLRYYEELGLLPGVRRRSGGRRVYGADEIERLRFIQRLKALGLSLAEIKELNALYAIAGSTRAMLARLDELLGRHLADVDARIGELMGLRDEIQKYRNHVATRRDGASAGQASAQRAARPQAAQRAEGERSRTERPQAAQRAEGERSPKGGGKG